MDSTIGSPSQVLECDGAVAVIVPPVVCHALDAHTGIPFMPHMAAYVAGALREHGRVVQVFDCFGLQPNERRIRGEFMLLGADPDWVATRLAPDLRAAYIYCRTIAEFIAVEALIVAISEQRPDVHIILFENVQAVTSYALKHVAEEFLKKGAHLVVTGEPETRVGKITDRLELNRPLDDITGVVFLEDGKVVATPDAILERDVDGLPSPAWDLFPLDGYWRAGFAHAPVAGGRFLPILTSRGCPYRCTFCIAPEVNPIWRGRSAKNVVDEMELFYRSLGITDFHVSDLNPTVNDKRTREICAELIERRLPITWKLAQGTKIETIKSEETLELMAAAGCRFVSFSPESGSSRLLKIMNKPFDHDHALRMARKMRTLGIRMQAVFIGGVPGETEDDRRLSVEYATQLVRAGVDEISLVIFTPLPGAELSNALPGFKHYSQCTPSPNWRKDYPVLKAYRRRMYLNFFYRKLQYPRKILREVSAVLFTHRFETKMEMSIFKQAKLYMLRFCPWVFRRLDADAMLKRLEQKARSA